MATALPPTRSVSPSIKWSVYAGLYTFLCGSATAFILSDMLGLLADVIGLPARYAMILLASPTLVIGAGTWWAVVERRASFTYLGGGTFGLVTALLTGLLWTGWFVRVWGFEMLAIPIVSFLVLLVLGMVGVAGLLAGLPFMYARRRREGGPSGGTGQTA